MKTISELKKEKLLIRAKDPERSAAIGLLIDSAEKIAKADKQNPNREVNEKDVISAAMKFVKEIEGDIQLLKDANKDYSSYEKELVIYKEFLPTFLSEDETRKIVASIPESDRIKKNMGKFMAQFKSNSEINPSILSKVLGEILK